MHKCPYCCYYSPRQYNLNRHIYIKHYENENIKRVSVTSDGTNVTFDGTNVTPDGTNVTFELSTEFQEKVCPKCYKDFSSIKGYKLHLSRCKGNIDSLECQYCHNSFNHRSNKSRHEKKCSERFKELIETKESITNIPIPTHQTAETINNNIQINNNQQININLLAYPPNGVDSPEFDFLRDHITSADMKRIFDKVPAELGFRKYIYSIFERPENRIVQKTHPNNNYSKVHVGDGKWSIELDDDVYKVITHFLTCAALQSTDENKKFIKTIESNIKTYLDDVNTQNGENDNYQKATQRTKLIIVNLTNKWKEEGFIQN